MAIWYGCEYGPFSWFELIRASRSSGTSIEKAVLSIVGKVQEGMAEVSSLQMGPRREADWVVAGRVLCVSARLVV